MWRDPNFWYIAIVGSIGVWAFFKRLYKSYHATADTAAASAPGGRRQVIQHVGSTPQVLTLAQVLTYLNDRADDAPHGFIFGGTGAGKSTFAKLLLAARVARGDHYVILTGKRSQAFAGLPCVGRDGVGDYTSIEQMCRALLDELIARDRTPLDQRHFTPLTIVFDDATILLAASDTAVQLFRECALIGREVHMRMLVLLGSLRVKELGIEGRGDLREHFAVVQYHKQLDGSRTTTLRARFDDNADVPFDATPVPHYAERVQIAATQAWQPPQNPDDELAALLLVPEHDATLVERNASASAQSSEPHEQGGGADLPFSPTEIIAIVLHLTSGALQTEVITAMPGYSGRKHRQYVRYYETLKQQVDAAQAAHT